MKWRRTLGFHSKNSLSFIGNCNSSTIRLSRRRRPHRCLFEVMFHGHLATVARNIGCEAYRVGVVADHRYTFCCVSSELESFQSRDEIVGSLDALEVSPRAHFLIIFQKTPCVFFLSAYKRRPFSRSGVSKRASRLRLEIDFSAVVALSSRNAESREMGSIIETEV